MEQEKRMVGVEGRVGEERGGSNGRLVRRANKRKGEEKE